ncbi:hypothetical protein [Rhizobium sp. BK176]|uniref:hypothetical protein n=1 Tax=Rhizobium sp. BK176 TaxID=2587071 RepID=UPI0021699DAC|nr:hypothetical protein [Rhizobium sp. BK176]MCS4092683.1 hypothetical protein [Rhizobium sp. BK176]
MPHAIIRQLRKCIVNPFPLPDVLIGEQLQRLRWLLISATSVFTKPMSASRPSISASIGRKELVEFGSSQACPLIS